MKALVRRQTLGDLLRRSAARSPHKLAIACGDTRWTYAEFDAHRRSRWPPGWRERGVAKGERRRDPRAQLARLRRDAVRAGAARRGAGADQFHAEGGRGRLHPAPRRRADAGHRQRPGDGRARRRGARHRRARICLAAVRRAERGAGRHDRLRCAGRLYGRGCREVDLAGDDLAQIVYTSGTESAPKGAMLTHDAVLWQYVSCVVDAGIARDDSMLHALPLYHCAQLDVFFGPAIYVGATNVITAKPTPDNLLPLIERHRDHLVLRAADGLDFAAALAAVRRRPTCPACARAITAPRSCRSRCCANWRSACPRCGLWNLYGQTEIAPLATMLGPDDQLRKPGSCGRAVLNVETRVVDDAMRDVAPGEVGEIVHRSPHLMLGYFHDDERTQGGVRGRLVPFRRPRHHRRRGLHHRRRPQEGHDQDRRRERRQPRGRGGDLPPAAGVAKSPSSACRIRAGSRRSWPSWCPSRARR